MAAWDSNLPMLVIAYGVFFLGLAGWGIYARGRLRSILSEVERLAGEDANQPGAKD